MDRLISHYRLLERLGRGGAAEVYKAVDLRLGRVVALKLLIGPRDGLLDEARAAASLSHPNIAAVYDVGEADGQWFIALEYVEGGTLADRLAEGPLAVTEALEFAIAIARGLGAAHEHGLIHGDVSAANIALGANGAVKILDFGLARRTEVVTAASGTPGYLAPEHLFGLPIDGRADLFSLGVVLYEMLSGHLPFAGQSWRRGLIDEEPPPLAAAREDIPLQLERIVRRALERDREDRYGSASELIDALERLSAELNPGLSSLTTHSRPDITAFRGLLPFQESDRDRFFGRNAESTSLVARITHSDFRFGVLYGESGSGKTSLLRAGVMPALWEAGYAPIYVRSHTGPLEALTVECRRASGVTQREGEAIADYLARVAETLEAPLVVILDQFEEFFVAFRTADSRSPFLEALAAIHADDSRSARVLVSMRSDFLYYVGSELADRIPEPLASSRLFQLRTFDEAAAFEVVEQSARRAGLPLEEDLGRRVSKDLAIEGSVLPSELQIVGEQLQNRRIYSVREYQRAGGKEVLVYGFLDDVIGASGDRETAGLILRSLISEENTRLTLDARDIARRTQRRGDRVARLLRLFVDARLVREIQDEQPWRYELVHEYLIDRINSVTGRVFDATQRANRLLRQYSSGYAEDPRTRVPLGKLVFIRRFSDRQASERESELLYKSLRSGIARVAAVVALVVVAGFATAAAFSVEETWDGARLSDGHKAAARRAVFSPDGRLLVTCGEDNKAIVWDFAARRRIATLDGHQNWVTSVAFSPDGLLVATASHDTTVIVWDAVRFSRVATLRGHRSPVTAIAFSPDGRRLISMTSDTKDAAIVWRTDSWSAENLLSDEAASWGNIVFLENGYAVLHAKIWNLETGQVVADLAEPLAGATWLALSPDTTRAVRIAGDGIVRFIDVKSGSQLAAFPAHHDHGRAVAYSPDGRLVATGAEDVVLWDAVTMTKLTRLQHSSIVWSLAFSPDGRWLVSTHGDGSVLVWDVSERERAANLNEHCAPVRGVAFSPDGRKLVTTSEDRSAIIWNVETGQKEATLVGHPTRVAGAAFSPDGCLIATVDQSANIIVWKAADGRRLETWQLPPDSDWRAGYCVAFSPDERWLVTSSYVIDRSAGRHVADFFQPRLEAVNYYAVAFSRDGRRLIGVSPPNSVIEIRSVDTWEVLQRMTSTIPMSFVTLSLAPDGKTFVTGDDQGRIELWDAETLADLGTIGSHPARVKSVAYAPDGLTIASCSDDQTIALWDSSGRGRVATIGTHAAPVLAVAFSPDGRRIVAGGHDNSVRIYTRHRSLWGYSLDGEGTPKSPGI